MYMINHQKTQRVRNHELLNGLWTAGVRRYPVVNNAKDLFIKSRKEAADTYESRFLLAQVREIRRCKPLVIVGHDVNGEYHNQVHIQNALCLQKAVELGAARIVPVWMSRSVVKMDAVKAAKRRKAPELSRCLNISRS